MTVPEKELDRLREAFHRVAPLQKKWPAHYDVKELHRAIVATLKAARYHDSTKTNPEI